MRMQLSVGDRLARPFRCHARAAPGRPSGIIIYQAWRQASWTSSPAVAAAAVRTHGAHQQHILLKRQSIIQTNVLQLIHFRSI
jgi:hypothetical protein